MERSGVEHGRPSLIGVKPLCLEKKPDSHHLDKGNRKETENYCIYCETPVWIEASPHHFEKENDAECKENNAYSKPFHKLNGSGVVKLIPLIKVILTNALESVDYRQENNHQASDKVEKKNLEM